MYLLYNFKIPIKPEEKIHKEETQCYKAIHLDTADPKFHDPINGNFSKFKQELKTIDNVKQFIHQYNTLDKNTIFIVHVNNNGNFMGNNYILEVLHALSQNQIKVAQEIVNKQEKFMINR